MSSDERLLNKGRLEEKEQQAQLLAVRIYDLKEQFRKIGDRHRPIGELNLVEVQAVSAELIQAQQLFTRLVADINWLREDLGMPRYETR